jgi:hypothetical protein
VRGAGKDLELGVAEKHWEKGSATVGALFLNTNGFFPSEITPERWSRRVDFQSGMRRRNRLKRHQLGPKNFLQKCLRAGGAFITCAPAQEWNAPRKPKTNQGKQLMKKLAITALATFTAAVTSFAGTEVTYKEYAPAPPPCFKDVEIQLDVFGSYTDSVNRSQYSDGFGGGLGLNYFFSRYVGFGVSSELRDSTDSAVWNNSGQLIVRYPIEGSFCVAPYFIGGGGILSDGSNQGTWHAGGGLEWRATHSFGVFAEGRYTWASEDDSANARLGVRFVF